MFRFFLRRVLFGVLVVWVISVAVFTLFYVAPSDPARNLAGRQANEEQVAAIRRNLGLDDPILEQYLRFVWNALHGDLGYSYYSGDAVTSVIAKSLPATLSLVAGGAIVAILLGLAIGTLSAVRPRTLWDRAATAFALFFYSMPTFLLGLLFLYFLFFLLHKAGLRFFPGGGYVSLTQDPAEWFRHMVLPWFTLALVLAATYVRLTRGSLLDVLGQDYVRTARAKGVSERRVTVVHGLRSAVAPVVTQFGIDVATLLGGVIITEQVFALGGLGQRVVIAVFTQDQPVIIGIVLLASVFIVVANILVDMLYAVLDPRVRLT